MSTPPIAGPGSAGGFVTVEHVLAVALALLLLVGLANVVLVQYARGVVRTALDDGVRAGARTLVSPGVAAAVCEDVAGDVHGDLLPGAMGDRVEIACTSDGQAVRAAASAAFASWIPGIPAWDIEESAVAAWEGTR